MKTLDSTHTKRNLAIFIAAVLGSAALAGIVERVTAPPGTPGLGQLLWLISPLVVALLLRLLSDGWGDLGLRPRFKGNGFWWWASVLLFPVSLAVSIGLGALLGGIELDVGLFPAFAAALLPALISAMLKNIFEEFAWRGYLAPRLYSLGWNAWLSHAIVGLVWGAWHLPFVLALWPYLTPGMLWAFVPLLLVGTVGQSVAYGEIRLATGSVWPAWAMHTIGNALGNALLLSGVAQLVPGKELWYSPGAEGVISALTAFAAGYWLHRRRQKRTREL